MQVTDDVVNTVTRCGYKKSPKNVATAVFIEKVIFLKIALIRFWLLLNETFSPKIILEIPSGPYPIKILRDDYFLSILIGYLNFSTNQNA